MLLFLFYGRVWQPSKGMAVATVRDGSSATVRDGSSATVRDGSSATVRDTPSALSLPTPSALSLHAPGDPLFPAMVGRIYISDQPWPGITRG